MWRDDNEKSLKAILKQVQFGDLMMVLEKVTSLIQVHCEICSHCTEKKVIPGNAQLSNISGNTLLFPPYWAAPYHSHHLGRQLLISLLLPRKPRLTADIWVLKV